MTAVEDIRAALKAAGPVARGRDRVLLVGNSAQLAIWCELYCLHRHPDPQIDGIPMRSTLEFDGWAIRDVDAAGVWHEVGEDTA